jgi:hypothetical protein
MIIKVPVDRRECFRRRIDYEADNVEMGFEPTELTDEERDWISKHLKNNGREFVSPAFDFRGICPPTKEEFLRVVRAFMTDTPPYGESAKDDMYEAP